MRKCEREKGRKMEVEKRERERDRVKEKMLIYTHCTHQLSTAYMITWYMEGTDNLITSCPSGHQLPASIVRILTGIFQCLLNVTHTNTDRGSCGGRCRRPGGVFSLALTGFNQLIFFCRRSCLCSFSYMYSVCT